MCTHSDIIEKFLDTYEYNMYFDSDSKYVAMSIEMFFIYLRNNNMKDLFKKIWTHFSSENIIIYDFECTSYEHSWILQIKVNKQLSHILKILIEEYKDVFTIRDFKSIFQVLLKHVSRSVVEVYHKKLLKNYFLLGDALRIIFNNMNEDQKIECGKIVIGNEELWISYNAHNKEDESNQEQKDNIKMIVIRSNILKILSNYLDMNLIFPEVWFNLKCEGEYGSQRNIPLERRFLSDLKCIYEDV